MADAAQWFYFREKRRQGPVTASDLQELFDAGNLPADTLVRSNETRAEWKPAHQIGHFRTPGMPAPPPAPEAASAPASEVVGLVSTGWASGPQVRPWIRFWARSLDFLLMVITLGFAFGLILPEALLESNLATTLLALLAAIAGEGLMLSAFGWTPGKWLLNVRVRDALGDKPSFGDSFSRTLWVWVAGIGLGIPIVTLITQVMSYLRLKEHGSCYWDDKADLEVQHREIPNWKGAFFVLLYAGIPVLLLLAFMGLVLMALATDGGRGL